MDEEYSSEELFQYLSQVYGTKDIVKTRRTIYLAKEIIEDGSDICQVIPSGSRVEGLAFEGSDFDVMTLSKTVRVYENLSAIDISDGSITIVMDTEETKLGFTRLQLLQNDNLLNQNYNHFLQLTQCVINIDGKHYVSSSSVRDLIGNLEDGITHGPCKMVQENDIETEILVCFRCKEWIGLLSSWTKRSRNSWPAQELLNKITESGILFVPVGCKTSKYEDVEWRISLSIAEKKLVHSFTHTQLLCYAMMKTILADIIKQRHGELLCSYFIKTIMFWLSEEYNPSFWNQGNLVHCYLVCLKRLIYCVQYRLCQHYFIPEINFFEGRFDDADHTALLYTLNKVYRGGVDTLLYTETLQNFQEICQINDQHYIESSVTSSAIEPFKWMNVFSYHNESPFEEVLRKDVGYCSVSVRRMILYLKSLTCNGRFSSLKTSFMSYENKQVYDQYKFLLPEILIGTKTDCVSGWCMLASLFYRLGLYKQCKFVVDDCINKCTPDKQLVCSNTFYILPNYLHDISSNRRTITSVLRHLFLDRVKFGNDTLYLLPNEMYVLEQEIINEGAIGIPSVAFLHFLDFLCAHHLRKNRAKKCSFTNLQRIIRDKYLMQNENYVMRAMQLLEVAYYML